MSDPHPTTPPPLRPVSGGLIALGVFFILLWIGAHVTWAMMSLIGTLMANDSSRVSNEAHSFLIFGLLGGQILAGAAGIPGGLAFFWRKKRRALWWWFGGLFVAGAALQGIAFYTFTSAWK